MRMSTDWSSIMNATGSVREQSRRENNGSRHRETMAINIECNQDNPKPRIKRGPSVNTDRANEIIKANNARMMHQNIMQSFGPRLVKHDGTARYTFQCKK